MNAVTKMKLSEAPEDVCPELFKIYGILTGKSEINMEKQNCGGFRWEETTGLPGLNERYRVEVNIDDDRNTTARMERYDKLPHGYVKIFKEVDRERKAGMGDNYNIKTLLEAREKAVQVGKYSDQNFLKKKKMKQKLDMSAIDSEEEVKILKEFFRKAYDAY